MRKLIIGCGYLGQRVADTWVGQGQHVFATTRKVERSQEFAQFGIEPIVCDVLRPDTLTRLPEVETVVYCVGLDRAAGLSMRQVYVTGLENVLAALPGRPQLVYVSSTSVYGQSDGSAVDEDAATEPVEESGRVVLEAEETLRKVRPDAIVLRFAGIYGPGRLFRARDLQAGRVLAIDPKKWLNLIHVDDGVRAVIAACDRGPAGAVYNICDDHPVRRGEFYTRLAQLLGAPPPRFATPDSAAQSERVNRRIVNARMRQKLGVELRYPSFEEGLSASA